MDKKAADKYIRKYSRVFEKVLKNTFPENADTGLSEYKSRLSKMYASDKFKKHNVYPTINTIHVYAVIAMCMELKKTGMSNKEIIDAINKGFSRRRNFFKNIIAVINIIPNSYEIAKKWNISDHENRVKDGSITYDYFDVSTDKVEYRISKCMYIEMFESYGIRGLCKIFCLTDEVSYAGLTRHVKFIRHSDLSDGESCFDEVIRKNKTK